MYLFNWPACCTATGHAVIRDGHTATDLIFHKKRLRKSACRKSMSHALCRRPQFRICTRNLDCILGSCPRYAMYFRTHTCSAASCTSHDMAKLQLCSPACRICETSKGYGRITCSSITVSFLGSHSREALALSPV